MSSVAGNLTGSLPLALGAPREQSNDRHAYDPSESNAPDCGARDCRAGARILRGRFDSSLDAIAVSGRQRLFSMNFGLFWKPSAVNAAIDAIAA